MGLAPFTWDGFVALPCWSVDDFFSFSDPHITGCGCAVLADGQAMDVHHLGVVSLWLL